MVSSIASIRRKDIIFILIKLYNIFDTSVGHLRLQYHLIKTNTHALYKKVETKNRPIQDITYIV